MFLKVLWDDLPVLICLFSDSQFVIIPMWFLKFFFWFMFMNRCNCPTCSFNLIPLFTLFITVLVTFANLSGILIAGIANLRISSILENMGRSMSCRVRYSKPYCAFVILSDFPINQRLNKILVPVGWFH